MTGAEFKAKFELAWDKPYSTYYDDTELNRLANYSLYNIVERDYRSLTTQKQYDEITNLIKTAVPVTLRDNLFHTSYLPIINVTEAGDTVTVTTGRPHYLDAGDSVTVSDVAGGTVTLINGTFTVLSTPSSTTFTYSSVGSAIIAYAAGSGKVQTSGFMLTDYYHYFAIKAIVPSAYSASVTNIVQNDAGFYADVTCPNHNLRTGDTFTLSGVSGFSNANGTYAPTQYTIRNKNVIRLTNITLLGTYSSGGAVTVVLSEWCTPYISDQKINTLNTPSVYNPRVETQQGTLRFYPTAVSSVQVDYMSTVPYAIDVTREDDNLLLYYSNKFLDIIITELVIQASASSRDFEFFQVENVNQSQNP
jgi:hypothetical protein